MRAAICAIILEEKRILVVKKRDHWIIPGGKPLDGETDHACLIREIQEELSGTRIRNIEYYATVYGQAPNRLDQIEVRTYFAEIDGVLGKPSNEISESDRIGADSRYQLSDPTRQIVRRLVDEKYI